MRREDIEHLSDRELLLLTAQEVGVLNVSMDKIGERVTTLEAWKNWMSGAIFIIGSAVGYKFGKS